MMVPSDEFWRKAESGDLNAAEAVQVAKVMHETKDASLRSKFIYALGKSGNLEFQGLIESFLVPTSDLGSIWAALTVLVTDWGVSSSKINETVTQFIEGAAWDEFAFIRELAVSLAGTIARDTGDTRMIRTLLRLARGEINVGPSSRDLQEYPFDSSHWDLERIKLRELAIDSLAYALGYSHVEIVASSINGGETRAMWERRIMAEASDLDK